MGSIDRTTPVGGAIPAETFHSFTADPKCIGEGNLFHTENKEEILKKCYRFDSRANSESRCSFSDERYHRFPKLRKCSPTMVHHFHRTRNGSDRVTSTYRLEDRRYTSHSTTSNRIRKDNEHINALIETLTEACDAFSAPASTTDNLLNLATGKATATATKYYLLQTLEQGKNCRKKFQEECADDENRFMKSIQRRKVENFASENSQEEAKIHHKSETSDRGCTGHICTIDGCCMGKY